MTEVPYYLPVADEVDIFRAAYESRLPVLLKGPTGCGKTRFVEFMAATLRARENDGCPSLITVACHEDLTGSDLVGRYLIGEGMDEHHRVLASLDNLIEVTNCTMAHGLG